MTPQDRMGGSPMSVQSMAVQDRVSRGGTRRRLTNEAKHMLTTGRALLRGVNPATRGALPDIVIIGAQRAGTTSLFAYLASHPDVRPAISKELHYLSFNAGRGEAWYRGHFPVLKPGERSIEASPFYMVDPNVPARAAQMLPDAHFVALLRNPVERALSHYLHNLEHGLEKLPFVEALAAEPERMRRAAAMGVSNRRGRALLRSCSYVHRGEYADRLAAWMQLIGAERLHVIRSEDLFQVPEQTYTELLDSLGLSQALPERFDRRNHWRDDPQSQLTPAVRRGLEKHFAPFNEHLETMLGWTRSWEPTTG